jgi:hypothetical protein
MEEQQLPSSDQRCIYCRIAHTSSSSASQIRGLLRRILGFLILATITRQAAGWIVDFNNPIVHTQYGSIRGKIDERKTKFNRRPICTFLSIPFARPPVGANRFMVSRLSDGGVCRSPPIVISVNGIEKL